MESLRQSWLHRLGAYLETLIDHLDRYGRVTTSLILSSPVQHRVISPSNSPLDHRKD